MYCRLYLLSLGSNDLLLLLLLHTSITCVIEL